MRLPIAVFALILAFPASALDLSGRVVNAAGTGLSNAHVYVYTALPKEGRNTICPSCYRDCGKREQAGTDGAFTLRGLDGKLKFRLLAVADGYEPAFSDYVASGPVTFKLSPRDMSNDACLVRGRVVDPADKPVVGAVVEPQGVRIGKKVGYGTIEGLESLSITNANGEFVLRVPNHTDALDVRVTARNFAPEIARNLIPGQDGNVVRVDIGASIAGRLMRDGKPVPNAVVGFDHKDRRSRNFLGTESIATDEKGFFLITGLGPSEEYFVFLNENDRSITKARSGKLVKVGADGTSVELGEVELK